MSEFTSSGIFHFIIIRLKVQLTYKIKIYNSSCSLNVRSGRIEHIENMYKKSTKIANVNQNSDLWIYKLSVRH